MGQTQAQALPVRLLGNMSQANQISRLERAARVTGRRLKLRRALTAASACLPLPLGYAALVVGVAKALPLSMAQARP